MKQIVLLCLLLPCVLLHAQNRFDKIEDCIEKQHFKRAIHACNKIIKDANLHKIAGAQLLKGEACRKAYFHKINQINTSDTAAYFALSPLLSDAVSAYKASYLHQDSRYSRQAGNALLELDKFLQIVGNRYVDAGSFGKGVVNLNRARIINEFTSEHGLSKIDTTLIYAQANAFELNGNFVKAAEAYEYLAELGASDIDIYKNCADLYLKQGADMKAVGYLDYASLMFPESFELFELNVKTLLQLKMYEDAFGEVDYAIHRFKNKELPLQFWKATTYHQAYFDKELKRKEKLEYFSIAEQAYLAAFKMDNDNPQYIAKLADLYYKHGVYLSTKSELTNLTELDAIFQKSKTALRAAKAMKANEANVVLTAQDIDQAINEIHRR